MPDLENEIKKKAKTMGKKVAKKILLILLPILLIFMLLAAAVYFITIDDGTYKEGDWGNTNYGASQYVNNVEVSTDGKISSTTNAKDLWKKMKDNGSDVDKYLDKPEELLKLMNAEVVTQYPDLRKDPDKKIDWDKVLKDSDSLQGIIKFKRAGTDNTKTTMTYVDQETFQGYIDEYNKTGSETAKQNALSHFTLKKTKATTSTTKKEEVAAGDGAMTDVSQAIIDATNSTPWPGESYCLRWVNDVYENAGLTPIRKESAYESYLAYGVSTDKSAIPIGAAVYGTGSGTAGGKYGHVGIYIGGGKVIDSGSTGIQTSTLEDWIAWQENATRNGDNVLEDINGQEQHGWLGWGWPDGNKTRGTTSDSTASKTNNNDKNTTKTKTTESKKTTTKKTTKETAVEKEVSGDGYEKQYTSSAGITYTLYQQYLGSYESNSYWDGTIHFSGCGPTSIAILSSGLQNSGLTPGDIASDMSYTSYGTLEKEMNALGMQCEVIQSPSAEVIQDNLRNGKVMLVSVGPNSDFTKVGHIMTLLDINTDGQVYIGNPGSYSEERYGWKDISEIMKDCRYIVVTDAGAAGIADSKQQNDYGYSAVVATWSETDTYIQTNDPNVQSKYGIGDSQSLVNQTFKMTTKPINYQEMVSQYKMPFDLLWAFLVVGEEKNFVMELADLVYNSEVEITVYDNLTVNEDVDDWSYKNRTKAVVSVTMNGLYNDMTKYYTQQSTINGHIDDPYGDDIQYNTKKTSIKKNNTINAVLTKANTWIVDYTNDYTYSAASSGTPSTSTSTTDNQNYSATPSRTENGENVTYTPCEELKNEIQRIKSSIISEWEADNNTTANSGGYFNQNNTGNQNYFGDDPVKSNNQNKTTIKVKPSESTVTVKLNYSSIEYYDRYIDIVDNISRTVTTTKYVKGVANTKAKDDPESDESNFVTIFRKKKHNKNYKNTTSVSSWLFEIIENNESTVDMLDLVKYLLYKATNRSYGVTEYDFSEFDPKTFKKFSTGEGGGMSLTTTMFTKEVFKQALQEYYNKTRKWCFLHKLLATCR
ncbi:membrane protein [Clostridium sp. CAG:356]|nr:membrane protein [Clostridium sp. CAG:356]